jgi:transglutaminase-like putative cysteine protease
MSARAYSPHLDIRNVLWLLAAMLFVVAPHLERLPNWVAIFFVVVLGWRAWISWFAIRFPPRAVVAAITIAATVGTFLQYGRITGREGGVTLLVVMAALKLLEMRTQREVTLAIYLGFFLVLTNFLFSQSIPLGVYLLACVWIFMGTLIGFNRVDRAPTVGERLRPAGALLVQALPLMAAFFLLFPRVQGPLWALPRDAPSGRTGLSDTMTPGQISELIKSDAIAFRVRFEGERPPYSVLYWRGPVLTVLDGSTWRALFPPRRASGPDLYESTGKPVRYEVIAEPNDRNELFALDAPGDVPPDAFLTNDLQIRTTRPMTEPRHYPMTSWLQYRYGERDSPRTIEAARRYDPARNPRTVALGREWAAETHGDARAIIDRAIALYNREFTYTLDPPRLDPRDPYDDFLFNTKRGFCEHYAGSFALLMRAAGIPARVVTGYLGGEMNPINHELLVRQADAHAWTEIWIAGEGWLRIDPTAAVSPLRIEEGVNAALGPIGVIPSLIAADKLGVLASLRFGWQVLNGRWEQWVVGYNVQRQRDFFASLGYPSVDWRTLGFWLLVATFGIGGIVTAGLLLRERPGRPDPSALAWQRYCAKLAAAGVARAAHEGPLDYLARVRAEKPAHAGAAEEITRRYIAARYGAGATREELRELASRVREFRPA